MSFLVNPYQVLPSASYLVDDYSPLVAFSLRKISSTATNAVRVRRSSDNTEQDIGFVGVDLDTSALSSFVGANNGFVTKWYNQGTGGAIYEVSQSSASNQPLIVSSGTLITKGGEPAITFNGSSQFLDVSFTQVNDPFSVFCVAGTEESTSPQAPLWHRMGTSQGWWVQIDRTAGKGLFSAQDISSVKTMTLTSQINSADPRLISAVITSGGAGTAYYNGTSNDTETYADINGTGEFGKISFAKIPNAGVYYNCYAQEAIYFLSDQTSNLAAINTEINSYYGIY